MSEPLQKYKWPYTYEQILEDFRSQTECINRCIDHYFTREMYEYFEELRENFKRLNIKRVLFIGNTFNYYASYIAFCQLCHSDVPLNFTWQIQELSEFYYYFLPTYSSKVEKNTLYIFISNSGQSRLLLNSIKSLRLIGVPRERIWLLTGNLETPVKQDVGVIFNTYLDKELVLGTKSFILNVIILHLIALLLQDTNPLTEKYRDALIGFVKNIEIYEQYREQITKRFLKMVNVGFSYIYYIGREPASYGVAALSALSTMSFTRIFAEGTNIGLFFHGPFQIIGRDHLAIVLVGESLNEERKELLTRLMDQLSNRITIRNLVIIRNCEPYRDYCDEMTPIFTINYKCRIEALSPLFQFNILQYILLELAFQRGIIDSETRKRS